MLLKERVLVKSVDPEKHSLKETLRLWWKMTEFGLLLDWCHPYRNQHRILNTLKIAGVVFNFLFLFAMAAFQLYQLIVGITTTRSVHAIVPFLVWFASVPIAISIQIYFILHRHQFLSFFNDWTLYERQFSSRCSRASLISELKKTRSHVKWLKISLIFSIPIAMTVIVFKEPEAPYLLSHYQLFRDYLTLPGVAIIHFMNIIVILVLFVLSDAVPGMVFYHIGIETRIILKEFEHLFAQVNYSTLPAPIKFCNDRTSRINERKFSNEIRQLIDCFETLRKLCNQSNRLFGVPIAQNHGIKFFIILDMLYSVFYEFKKGSPVLTAGLYFLVFLSNINDLARCILLKTYTYCSSEHLRVTLNSLLHQHWDLISKEDRELIQSFLCQLHTDPLAATPLSLYTITPSILLTLTSLTVTYLVILLQTN